MTEPTPQAQPGELPPLPEPGIQYDGNEIDGGLLAFTADQMRDYARAALASQATPGEWLEEAKRLILEHRWMGSRESAEGVYKALLAHLSNHPGVKT
jgi:hypothetical protein